MLNVKALNKLLTENADTRLFPRWFIMSPNGLLLAYTSPADIRELRDQVALVSMTWKEQLAIKQNETDEEAFTNQSSGSDHAPPAIHTMTMEFDKRNVLVRLLQPKLLLVLEGGVPPGRKQPLHVTVEGHNDTRYPPSHDSASDPSRFTENGNGSGKVNGHAQHLLGSPSSRSIAFTTGTGSKRRSNVLDLHRRKFDTMTEALRAEFQKSHFEMPNDPDERFF